MSPPRLALIASFLVSSSAGAQALWAGDFRDNNFYQFRYVQCGAYDGAGSCPYSLQTANVNTSTSAINCQSPGTEGCRFSLLARPPNSATYASDFAPAGTALKVFVAHNPDPTTLNGDTAPLIGNPWGDDHRNELNKARDFTTGDEILHGEGEERFYGWSTHVPSAAEFAEPDPLLNDDLEWHVAMQFHQAGQCRSPYIDFGIGAVNNPRATGKTGQG